MVLDAIFTGTLLVCFGLVLLFAKWCDGQISK